MDIRCQQCGKPVPYQGQGRPPTKFCSRKCKDDFRAVGKHAEAKNRRAQQRCVRCGEPVPPDAGNRALTCSKECSVSWQNEKKQDARRAAWQATNPVCQRCGEPMPESRHVGSKYCSPECKRREMSERWRERSPGYMRQYNYGLTPEQFDAMFAAQDGRCAICGSDKWLGGRKTSSPHVDHDHSCCPGKKSCGKCIRGLICGNCNNGLGMFGEDPARLRAAAEYLEKVVVCT